MRPSEKSFSVRKNEKREREKEEREKRGKDREKRKRKRENLRRRAASAILFVVPLNQMVFREGGKEVLQIIGF